MVTLSEMMFASTVATIYMSYVYWYLEAQKTGCDSWWFMGDSWGWFCLYGICDIWVPTDEEAKWPVSKLDSIWPLTLHHFSFILPTELAQVGAHMIALKRYWTGRSPASSLAATLTVLSHLHVIIWVCACMCQFIVVPPKSYCFLVKWSFLWLMG